MRVEVTFRIIVHGHRSIGYVPHQGLHKIRVNRPASKDTESSSEEDCCDQLCCSNEDNLLARRNKNKCKEIIKRSNREDVAYKVKENMLIGY